MLKVYEYRNCGTCRNALKYLDSLGVTYQRIPIREQVPSVSELSRMLGSYDGNIRKLFNTSGRTYRELGIKDRIGALSDSEAISLLRSNGNLIKRPFVINNSVALVGFNPKVWDTVFNL